MNLFIAPHPPIIIQEIGRGEEKKAASTILGMKKIADKIKIIKPKTIAVITPHGNVFGDALCINTQKMLIGDFSKFGHPEIKYQFENDTEKSIEICTQLLSHDISALALNKTNAKQYDVSCDLDHGVLVPLHFILKKYSGFKLIHISIGYLSKIEMYKSGEIIANILGDENVLIASGDLSHKLNSSSPYSYDKMGKVYDEYIVNSIKNKEFINILNVDDKMLYRAGQCAQKPLELFTGALEGYNSDSEVYSYEGPFGVGYMTARITRGKKSSKSILKEYLNNKNTNFKKITKKEDDYISLARNTINEYIKNKNKIEIPDNLESEMYSDRNGVFVSIKKEGQLRGCIGTISPTKKNIAQEIIDNAIAASTRDPRFNAIEEHELCDLQISVDILYPAEDIKSEDELDVKEYGVIVNKGYKRGLLLPNLEGVDSVKYQVSIALQKAGIQADEKYSLQRFKVVRHK